MKPVDVRKQIKAGETAPLYLLEGDDLQSRNELAEEFAGVVDEGLQAFNVESFYANEATTAAGRDELIGRLLSAARTLPMMAPRRVLIVHQAERLLSPRKGKEEEPEAPPPAAAAKKKQRVLTPVEQLEEYFESPEPMATVVFVAGEMDANRRLVKLARTHAVNVACGSLETQAEASRWIQRRLEADSLTIEPQAISLLLHATGLNLGRIRADVEKLALYAAGEKTVTARHVQDLVMPQHESEGEFPLGHAIWKLNAAAAVREVTAELDSGKPPFMVLGSIRYAVGRPRYGPLQADERIRSGLDAVFETDLAIKSSLGEPRFLLERLVIELCARR